MNNLGDFFSAEMKKQFAENNINIGATLLVRISDFNVKYPKYIILVAENNNNNFLAYVVINTKINSNIFPTEYLKSLHVKIDKANHNFLDYDSFVDCTKLREFLKKDVIDFITNNPKKVVGNVTDIIMKKIQNTITRTRTIDEFTKKKFGYL